ncbi:AaceriAEL172Wp [[Ashbya] aceris (nom. inval.)]|nr:AaceriAEL172Wp [[Ashbya] aceris (nom. inval.)]
MLLPSLFPAPDEAQCDQRLSVSFCQRITRCLSIQGLMGKPEQKPEARSRMNYRRKVSAPEAVTYGASRESIRKFSTSSDLLPQNVPVSQGLSISADKDKPERSPSSNYSSVLPSLSRVGFQSIFQNNETRRSRQSVLSESLSGAPVGQNDDRVPTPYNYSQLIEQRERGAGSYGKSSSSLSLELHVPKTRMPHGANPNHANGLSRGKNSLKQAAIKLFRVRSTSSKYQDTDVQPGPWMKFLHSQHGKHQKSPYVTANVVDSNKSIYSQGQSQPSNLSDKSIRLFHEVNFDNNDVQLLHDLIKNMPSFESNFHQFTIHEQDALLSNIWGVYCNLLLSVFKNHRLWQLPAKIEDINRVLKFYIRLKQDGKTACTGTKFLSEIEQCLRASFYVLETQVLYDHAEGIAMQSALKRLCAVWELFYQHAYGDSMAVLAPLDSNFQRYPQYWCATQDSSHLTLAQLLFQMFRDSIVVPYYQTFMNDGDNIAASFQKYFTDEDEKNCVTQAEKLLLLQCFGLLSSLNSRDVNQQIVQGLLAGVRMSI